MAQKTNEMSDRRIFHNKNISKTGNENKLTGVFVVKKILFFTRICRRVYKKLLTFSLSFTKLTNFTQPAGF